MSANGGKERPGRQLGNESAGRDKRLANGRLGAALRKRPRAGDTATAEAAPVAAASQNRTVAATRPAPARHHPAIVLEATGAPRNASSPGAPRQRAARTLAPALPEQPEPEASRTLAISSAPALAPEPAPPASAPDLAPVEAPRTRRQRVLPDPDRALNRRMRTTGPILFGFVVLLAFAAGAAWWSAVAELEKGATAIGRVIVQTKAKNIQHRSGGKVERILVAEGQTVAAGDTILVFDTANAREQLDALRSQLTVSARQTQLLAQEIEAYEDLLARQLTTRSRVLQLRRQAAEVEKEAHRLEAQIANLAREVEQSTVTAPVSGRVLRLAVFAPGEVIAPGGVILQLVPAGDSLEIEARLGAQDVAQVHPGMAARVWLSAFSRRESAPLDAKVAWVSPDAVEDERAGTASYVVRLVLTDPAQVPGGPEALIPGMQAEAMIVTGRKTLLQQLLEPLTRSLSRATRT
ncbi:MAG: HlyD family efflux transporter periplasmic adaptor subunit [Rhizobiales bacterium]|nr:HlyD family efflux transporter periplasmic adaptor subunit [Hyphomicrobiales bacterium]